MMRLICFLLFYFIRLSIFVVIDLFDFNQSDESLLVQVIEYDFAFFIDHGSNPNIFGMYE